MIKAGLTVFLMIVFSGVFAQSTNGSKQEPVQAAASRQYADPTFIQRVLLGTNYREEWETPVEVPVFRIKEMGFEILELGGGMQTKSLRLKDIAGKEWVLRTVEKDVEPNLPPQLRNTIAEYVLQDMISAAHPYAPLSIPVLARPLGVVVPEPTLYFVPSDPNLEPYKDIFAQSLCFLEEREPTPDNSETKSTEDVLETLVATNEDGVAQERVLKARLLDMLLADWDRHADQWRWGSYDSAGTRWHYAIPRDRDQAYFYSNGLLIKIARYVAARHFVGFRGGLTKLTNLNFKAWKFDKTFINRLDESDWERIINETTNSLSDAVLENAVLTLPPPIFKISGKEIQDKLKERRADLLQAGMKYYRFLANSVTINGTDKSEIFVVRTTPSGLQVTVFDEQDGSRGRLVYTRTFNSDHTDEILITGLGGSDKFIIEEGTASRIQIKIWGGDAPDTYNIKGSIKNTIYEQRGSTNNFQATMGTRFKDLK